AQGAVSVFMLALDAFKRVNDVYGHGIGDQTLVALANVLTGSVRAADSVCRIGGEEFGVIMPSTRAGDGLGLARRIQERLEELEVEAGTITVSVGVSEAPLH